MKITCHSCSAKYTVSDDKVQGKTVKMKCRKCGATIVVGASSGTEAGADAGHGADAGMAMEGGDGPPAGSFLVSVGDGDQRTMTLAEVVEAYNGAVITAETYVWAEGMSDWQALSDNQEICAALNEAASGASSAMSSGGYSAGFGSSPPAAAPVAAKKDNARRSQDLFAAPPDSYSGGGGFGSNASFGSAGALAPSGSVGKRDENSVLFSLNALTAVTSAPIKSTKEDSGLIDLKALAAAAPSEAQDHSPDSSFLMAPVIAPIPQPQPQMNYAAPVVVDNKRSQVPIIVGGVVALAAIVAVFMLVRGGETKTDPTSKPAAEQTAAPTTAPTALTAAPPATTTGTPTADPSATLSGQPVAVGPKPTGKVPPATAKPGTTTAKPNTTAAATTKPAGKGNCGCPPGNLDCMLKCSVGKK